MPSQSGGQSKENKSMLLANSTWEEIDRLDRNTIVVLPFAAMEQHSLHLPLKTDTLIGEQIVLGLNREFEDSVLFAPVQWLGLSLHHTGFAGTMTATVPTYIQLVSDTIVSVLRTGFRKIVLLNSHGGNISILDVAIANVRPNYPDASIFSVTYWRLAAKEFAAIRESPLGGMGHACEMETSIVLHAEPALVRKEKAQADGIWPNTPLLAQDMMAPGVVGSWDSFSDVTRHGGYGDPTIASAEKGSRFLNAAVEKVADFIRQLQADQLWPADKRQR